MIENDVTKVGSVAAWQNILNGSGFNPTLSITGVMDDATVSATKAFQKDVNFSETGNVDLGTWKAGLGYAKLPDWSDQTPPTSARRNLADATFGKDPSPIGWTREELRTKLVAEAAKVGLTLPTQLAYMMATIEWETAGTFEPVREAYWFSEDWRAVNLQPYYPYYGRGYVQLTWDDNYSKYAEITGLDLVGEPDQAMQPDVALKILVDGFKHGRFTGISLEECVDLTQTDYLESRRCINGRDKAQEIADIAADWERFFSPNNATK
jgi:peptidoglycan hydrolase-like protein with peptidoglycan-binding domain